MTKFLSFERWDGKQIFLRPEFVVCVTSRGGYTYVRFTVGDELAVKDEVSVVMKALEGE